MEQANLLSDSLFEQSSSSQHSKAVEYLALASNYYDASCDSGLSTAAHAAKLAQARGYAKEVLKLQPDNADALNLLGRIALDENCLDEAATYIRLARKYDPESAGYSYSQGHVHLANQDYDLAEKAFEHAIQKDRKATRAPSSLAYTKLQQGKHVEAFQQYRQLIKEHPQDQHIRAKLFEVAAYLKADYYAPELEMDLLYYLQFEEVNYNQLARLISSLLTHKYGLDKTDSKVELSDLSGDPLLLQAMTKLYFTCPEMENLLTNLRTTLLVSNFSRPTLDPDFSMAVIAMGHYSANNEYVYYVKGDEYTLLEDYKQRLCEALQKNNWKTAEVTDTLLVLAMYMPLAQLDEAEILNSRPLEDWPLIVRPLLQKVLAEKIRERRDAAQIASLTGIRDDVSLAVQRQYEENPYPRWLSLNFHAPTSYCQALQLELKGFKAPGFFRKGPLKILVAGCGTGKHALQVASYFRNVQVVAVDISRVSLAYAQKMARKYKLSNISFQHADILELDDWQERFHIVECSGVIHHMDEPEAGLRQLLKLLLPEGLIKLGLYSRQARDEVLACHHKIREFGFSDKAEHIRSFRQLLLNDELGIDTGRIKNSADFYNMSGCRDLLFHTKEHQYDPLTLERLCKDNGLQFLGFVQLSAAQKKAYLARFPEDKRLRELQNWKAFETEYPDTFNGMYQFYCQLA